MVCAVKVTVCRAVAAACMVLVLWSCGNVPVAREEIETGSVEMQVQLAGVLGKRSAVLTTEFDSLVMEISASDMETVRRSKLIGKQETFTIDTVSGIPAGSGRTIRVFTINKAGEVVHEDSAGVRTVKIEPNILTVVPVLLLPLRGSIYLQIAGIPSSVDSVVALFDVQDGKQYRVCAPRSSKLYLSLDGIPHKTKGVVIVAGVSAAGDTLYRAQKEVTVNAHSGTSVPLTFESTPGGLSLSGTIVVPAVTLITTAISGFPVAGSERGDVIITEIMYAANDSEYIECYNPGEQRATFDSLIVDIDGTKRIFTNIQIEAKAYFVFGRIALPWADGAYPVKSALDLSANGNWITLCTKDGVVIDQVIFTGGTNTLDWPKVTGKQSIALSPLLYSASANNLGRSWLPVTSPIEGAAVQFGSPRKG